MQRHMSNQRRRHKLNSKRLIMCFIVTTIMVTILTLSKYKTTTAKESSAKVAFPAIDLLSDEILDVDINPTTEDKELIFAVTNTEEEKRTEVAMNYTVKIESLSNLPLEFELYTYDNNTKGTENLLQGNGNITDDINFNFNEDKTDTYMLIIKWKEGQTDYRYNHTIDYVQIVINGVQVD